MLLDLGFEESISAENPDVVLADEVKSLDWRKSTLGGEG
jgi:hypothetical protein